MSIQRIDGRTAQEIRPVNIVYNAFGYADGSVLLSIGDTKVLCTVTIQNNVPPFLRGQHIGWLTAEYAMLPNSSKDRIPREISLMKKNSRSTEISRFIGRALRMMVNLTALGERTILIDCDVLQADGGTRVAAITGASLALQQAEQRWLQTKLIREPITTQAIAAISIGIKDGYVIADPNYAEDSNLSADCNVVMTESGDIIELQSSAEKEPITWEQLQEIHTVARASITKLFSVLDNLSTEPVIKKDTVLKRKKSGPLFSLQNR